VRFTFIQTPLFLTKIKRMGFTDEDLQALEAMIMDRPDAGDVMQGTGGLRKVRFAPPSWHVGKSGATRVCYIVFAEISACYFLMAFQKNEKPNLTAPEKASMRKWIEATRKRSRKA
jgi:hypothetical protein